MSAPARRFRVNARLADPHEARVVYEPSFEAAAIAYLEDLPSGIDAAGEISLVVHDLANGHEHCFRVDLETGESTPCK